MLGPWPPPAWGSTGCGLRGGSNWVWQTGHSPPHECGNHLKCLICHVPKAWLSTAVWTPRGRGGICLKALVLCSISLGKTRRLTWEWSRAMPVSVRHAGLGRGRGWTQSHRIRGLSQSSELGAWSVAGYRLPPGTGGVTVGKTAPFWTGVIPERDSTGSPGQLIPCRWDERSSCKCVLPWA